MTLSSSIFSYRLKSTEYVELQEKLHAPIRNAANVVIHLTMSELFLETFKSYVRMNDVYRCPSGQVKPLYVLYFQYFQQKNYEMHVIIVTDISFNKYITIISLFK